MVSVSNFPNAYKEVYTILKYVDDKDLALIPEKFINTIKARMSKDYEFKYDVNRTFDEQNVLRETKAIFSYIFLNYWASQAQADVINARFRKDIEVEERNKQEKYNPDNIFKNRERPVQETTTDISNTVTEMVEYKESIFTKIKNWFKRLFS